MKNIFLFLFLVICFGINAQSKASVSIVSFTIDTVVHYELKYSGDKMDFQIEEFNEGKWNVIGSMSEGLALNLNKEKEFTSKNEFKGLRLKSGEKYRLKTTYPIMIISEEIEYKK